jgi:glutathione synthase/RimK-type ligase-like ATP-grasp enzyme
MPKPDLESHLLVEALRRRGVDASLVPWDSAFDWTAADLVVIRTPWDYFQRIDEFLQWADDVGSVTRLANPASVVRWNTHKRYLLDLAAAGVATVTTRIVPKGTTEVSADWLPEGDEVVIKPAVSIGAIGAFRTSAEDPQAAAHILELAASGDVLVQPFVSSVLESGETSLMFAGGRLSHAVRKVPAPGEYRVQDHHGGSVRHHRATADEIAVSRAALAVAPASVTYARVDLVSTDQGPVVMELELVEPALFLDADPRAPAAFADALLSLMDGAD